MDFAGIKVPEHSAGNAERDRFVAGVCLEPFLFNHVMRSGCSEIVPLGRERRGE